MTQPFDLEAIRSRVDSWKEIYDHEPQEAKDIDQLIAEVDRLRAQIEASSDFDALARDERDHQETQLLEERDNAIEWADKLAAAIAPFEVRGEHSNGNNPWANALDYARKL
ncbi:hypothetical protein [Nocardiopsis sp. NRRL B-16309]|uniref:hypothetical protein n=1 Tax=Nocardiopsis sp. NRRL B-16309 TaxID=1519494 RepID=UPI0006B02641|nr:hypothetical protein [Nocardiopsis sp. NRRL B-16309]KOX10176.1 hypothetical protein ADL05_26245 [Nocardiopsis sp. NRRL B-16309]